MEFAPNIILVGASVRSLASSAIQDGWRPICADMFADADLDALLLDPQQQLLRFDRFDDLPELLSRLDAHLPVLLSGGLENHPAVLSQIQSRHVIIGSSVDALIDVRNPMKVFEAFAKSGCRVPMWRDGIGKLVSDGIDESRWLRKSRCSSGGTGVRQFSIQEPVTVCNASDYLQEYVEGTPISATFVSQKNESGRVTLLLGAALQLTGCEELNASEFRFCGNAGPLLLPNWLQQAVSAVGRSVAAEFQLDGVFGVDFLLNASGLWALEVNPRITASHELHEWASCGGLSHVSLHMGRCPGDKRYDALSVSESAEKPFNGTWARLIIYAGRDLWISPEQSSFMLGLTRSCSEPPHSDSAFFLADIPLPNIDIPRYKPLCSLYVDLKSDWELPVSLLMDQLSFAETGSIGRLLRQICSELQAVSGDLEFPN